VTIFCSQKANEKMDPREVAFLFENLGDALQRAAESLPGPGEPVCNIDRELTWFFCSLSAGLQQQAEVIRQREETSHIS
jgi:hypothetical protein